MIMPDTPPYSKEHTMSVPVTDDIRGYITTLERERNEAVREAKEAKERAAELEAENADQKRVIREQAHRLFNYQVTKQDLQAEVERISGDVKRMSEHFSDMLVAVKSGKAENIAHVMNEYVRAKQAEIDERTKTNEEE